MKQMFPDVIVLEALEKTGVVGYEARWRQCRSASESGESGGVVMEASER